MGGRRGEVEPVPEICRVSKFAREDGTLQLSNYLLNEGQLNIKRESDADRSVHVLPLYAPPVLDQVFSGSLELL